MIVSEIMSTKVTTVSPTTKLPRLWKLIFVHKVHAVPVLNDKKVLLGMVAKADLMRPLYPDYEAYIDDFTSAVSFDDIENRIEDLSTLTAEKLMSTRVVFVRPNTPIMRALTRMIVHKVHALPVISTNGDVVGVVSRGDIFNILFVRHFAKKSNKTA
jgi:CBS-domain-containing membrane protein